jgi:hypothetical protein
MRVPTFTEFHLSHEGEWLYAGSDAVQKPTPPRTVAVARVFLDGRPHEVRGTTPSSEAYLARILARHPFDPAGVRAFVVLVHGRPEVVVQARSKFEAVRQAGLQPEGLEVRAKDEVSPDDWRRLVESA